jgi:hypothetical protein
LVHNKTNDDIVFHVDHEKTIVSKAFWFITKSTMALSFMRITKKIVSKAFRFATKSTTVLSFLWITKNNVSKASWFAIKQTMVLSFLLIKKCFKSLLVHNKTNDSIVFPIDHKKIFQKPSGSQQNQQQYYLFYWSPENVLR